MGKRFIEYNESDEIEQASQDGSAIAFQQPGNNPILGVLMLTGPTGAQEKSYVEHTNVSGFPPMDGLSIFNGAARALGVGKLVRILYEDTAATADLIASLEVCKATLGRYMAFNAPGGTWGFQTAAPFTALELAKANLIRLEG